MVGMSPLCFDVWNTNAGSTSHTEFGLNFKHLLVIATISLNNDEIKHFCYSRDTRLHNISQSTMPGW